MKHGDLKTAVRSSLCFGLTAASTASGFPCSFLIIADGQLLDTNKP